MKNTRVQQGVQFINTLSRHSNFRQLTCQLTLDLTDNGSVSKHTLQLLRHANYPVTISYVQGERASERGERGCLRLFDTWTPRRRSL